MGVNFGLCYSLISDDEVKCLFFARNTSGWRQAVNWGSLSREIEFALDDNLL